MKRRANSDGAGLFGAELADVEARLREAREGWCWACGAPATRWVLLEPEGVPEMLNMPRAVGVCPRHEDPQPPVRTRA